MSRDTHDIHPPVALLLAQTTCPEARHQFVDPAFESVALLMSLYPCLLTQRLNIAEEGEARDAGPLRPPTCSQKGPLGGATWERSALDVQQNDNDGSSRYGTADPSTLDNVMCRRRSFGAS